MGYQITKDTKLTGEEIIELIKERKFGDRYEVVTGVYKITNLINNKVYIGSSCALSKGIKGRWKYHIFKLLKNSHESKYLQNSWNKYGAKNFEFSILELIPKENGESYEKFKKRVREKEQYFLNFYNACDRKNGYNLSLNATGGNNFTTEEKIRQGKAPFTWGQYLEMKKLLINTDESFAEISRKTGIHKKYIANIYNRKNLIEDFKNVAFSPRNRETIYDFLKKNYTSIIIDKYLSGENIKQISKDIFSQIKKENIVLDTIPRNVQKILKENNIKTKTSKEMSQKRVFQYDLQGNFIKEWDSISEAGKELNIQRTKISSCIRGERQKAGNYIWSYEKKEKEEIINPIQKIMEGPYNKRNKPILCYSLDGKPQKIYSSLRNTKEITHKSYEYLGQKLKKNKKVEAYGFYWIYLENLNGEELESIYNLKVSGKIKIEK